MNNQYHLSKAARDKLYITEILNDLHRHGFSRGGKAECLLRGWARELREEARENFPASHLKKVFTTEVGKENW